MLAVVVAAATAALFVSPPGVVAPRNAPATDAVVVLSGAERSRLAAGLAVIERHDRAILAISTEDAEGPAETCDRPRRLCFHAEPFATRGEARAVAALAAEHGWDSVAIVTSTYHLSRSRMLVRQCFDGEVVMVDAGHGRRSERSVRRAIAREWVAYAAGLTVQRAC